MKVLDACGILHSDLDFSTGRYYITNSVLAELMDETAKLIVEQGMKNKFIKIKDPRVESIKEVTTAAKTTGDLQRLSQADIDVLALALESKAEIVSDDYGIQNVANTLNIKYHTTAQEGITKTYIWEKVCPGCGLKHSHEFKTCEVCGTKLKRVVKNVVKE